MQSKRTHSPTRNTRHWGFTLILVYLGVLYPPLSAAATWTSLATPHFRLYTTGSEERALRTLDEFERARSFFSQTSLGKTLPEAQVNIIAFSNAREYEPYQMSAGAYAYYQRGRKADYIVMQDLSPEHSVVALHEYTHYVIAHAGLRLPTWLNEGLADLYSSLQARGRQAIVGASLAERLYALRNLPVIDIETMLAVDHRSPYYTEPTRMWVFYAQSWALTHMLAIGEQYSAQFPRFVSLLSEGHSARESFRIVYGKDLLQVEADLRDYLQKGHLPTCTYDIDLSAASLHEEPVISTTTDAHLEIILADVLASNPSLSSELQTKLTLVSSQHPETPLIEEDLGYLALKENRLAEARAHFAIAVERHSMDPDVLYRYAQLEQAAGMPADEVIALLERAIAIQPDDYNARLTLGWIAAKAGKFPLAISTLLPIRSVETKDAYVFYYTLAYCHVQVQDLEHARAYGEQASQYAQNAQQKKQTDGFLRYINDVRKLTAANETAVKGT